MKSQITPLYLGDEFQIWIIRQYPNRLFIRDLDGWKRVSTRSVPEDKAHWLESEMREWYSEINERSKEALKK